MRRSQRRSCGASPTGSTVRIWRSRGCPTCPTPDEAPLIEDLLGDAERHTFAFWENFEYRPLAWLDPDAWATRDGMPAEFRAWCRFLPTAVFDDPYVEAARVTTLVDVLDGPRSCARCPPTSRRAGSHPTSTSASRSTTRRRARSTSCSTAPRRSPRAVSPRVVVPCGHPTGGCSPPGTQQLIFRSRPPA